MVFTLGTCWGLFITIFSFWQFYPPSVFTPFLLLHLTLFRFVCSNVIELVQQIQLWIFQINFNLFRQNLSTLTFHFHYKMLLYNCLRVFFRSHWWKSTALLLKCGNWALVTCVSLPETVYWWVDFLIRYTFFVAYHKFWCSAERLIWFFFFFKSGKALLAGPKLH